VLLLQPLVRHVQQPAWTAQQASRHTHDTQRQQGSTNGCMGQLAGSGLTRLAFTQAPSPLLLLLLRCLLTCCCCSPPEEGSSSKLPKASSPLLNSSEGGCWLLVATSGLLLPPEAVLLVSPGCSAWRAGVR
jgi:hypothetical protein